MSMALYYRQMSIWLVLTTCITFVPTLYVILPYQLILKLNGSSHLSMNTTSALLGDLSSSISVGRTGFRQSQMVI